MTEFKKWWDKYNRKPLPKDEYDMIEDAWRAALELVSKNWIYSHTIPEDEDFIKIIKVSIIKKELEE